MLGGLPLNDKHGDEMFLKYEMVTWTDTHFITIHMQKYTGSRFIKDASIFGGSLLNVRMEQLHTFSVGAY